MKYADKHENCSHTKSKRLGKSWSLVGALGGATS